MFKSCISGHYFNKSNCLSLSRKIVHANYILSSWKVFAHCLINLSIFSSVCYVCRNTSNVSSFIIIIHMEQSWLDYMQIKVYWGCLPCEFNIDWVGNIIAFTLLNWRLWLNKIVDENASDWIFSDSNNNNYTFIASREQIELFQIICNLSFNDQSHSCYNISSYIFHFYNIISNNHFSFRNIIKLLWRICIKYSQHAICSIWTGIINDTSIRLNNR